MGLRLPHVQLDEIRTRLRAHRDVLWLWLAVDPVTKIVPVVHLGPRTQASAHALIHALAERLAPGWIPAFTSDGLRLYYYALTYYALITHFGCWVSTGHHRAWQVAATLVYGQVQKQYRHRRLVRVAHRVVCGTPAQFRAALQALGLSGRLNTAFVERLNLTIRQGVSALARRTWATAQTEPGLQHHIAWWRGYYHVVRPHHTLRMALLVPGARAGRRSASGIEPARRRWRLA